MTRVPVVSAQGVRIRVLGWFELLVGGSLIPVAINAQRVLSYLAVVDQTQRRETLAGRLWPESSQARAQSSLRDALWRIRTANDGLVQATREVVRLQPDVAVDLAESQRLARQLIAAGSGDEPAADEARRLLGRDVLPSWDDDWLMLERERTRQLRIHALEALSRSLTEHNRFAEAIEAALAAIEAEPLRESAHVVLAEAYIAEGNPCEAVRALSAYRSLVADELGLAPSARFEAFVTAATRRAG